jgi:hypothetical protein
MNNHSPKSRKNLVIGIVVVAILAGGAWWYFYQNGAPSVSTSSLIPSSSPGNPEAGAVGSQVLTVLNSVSSISIDASFFTSAAYQSLVDYSVSVPPQPVGRSNPFAPVGASAPVPQTGSNQ